MPSSLGGRSWGSAAANVFGVAPGGSWASLGALFGLSGAALGASWAAFGAVCGSFEGFQRKS